MGNCVPKAKGVSVLLRISAAIAFCAGAAVFLAQPGAAQDTAEPDIENGRAVAVGAYAREPGGACFRCHGIDGAGDSTAGFPRLTDQTFNYLYESLQAYASGERPSPIMQPIAQSLSEAEMRDVSAYYASLADAPYPPPSSVDPEVLQMGAMLSAIGSPDEGIQACVNCHGPEGVGLPPTYPFIGGQNAAYLEQQLLLFKSGERKGDEFGLMRYIASLMSDEQITAAANYFASLRPAGVTPEPGPGELPAAPVAVPPDTGPIPDQIPGVE